MDELDFSLMDYDTYHVIMGGTYDDYLEWQHLINITQSGKDTKEETNFSDKESNQSLYPKTEEVQRNRQEIDKETNLKILLIVLEMMAYKYGFQGFPKEYQNISLHQQLELLFSFYETVGFQRDEVIPLLRNYLSGNRKKKSK